MRYKVPLCASEEIIGFIRRPRTTPGIKGMGPFEFSAAGSDGWSRTYVEEGAWRSIVDVPVTVVHPVAVHPFLFLC